MNYTPGPWQVKTVGAFTFQIEPADGRQWTTTKEHDANRVLIAAAPDILEALEELLFWTGANQDEPITRTELMKATFKARSVIEGLKGE